MLKVSEWIYCSAFASFLIEYLLRAKTNDETLNDLQFSITVFSNKMYGCIGVFEQNINKNAVNNLGELSFKFVYAFRKIINDLKYCQRKVKLLWLFRSKTSSINSTLYIQHFVSWENKINTSVFPTSSETQRTENLTYSTTHRPSYKYINMTTKVFTVHNVSHNTSQSSYSL